MFGLLGGAILGDLEYDALARHFDFDGGEVGAYATYLRGGLFVDTLANAQFLDIEPEGAPIFRGSLDSTNFGLRTDAGYRFGGFNRGFFFEPLATIGVVWSDIDGFTREGSTVSFDDDANVRGRHGLRVGTSYEAWQGILMEPFLIGSVWSNLSGDNQARITSSGSIDIEDDPEDTGARSLPGSTSSIQTRAPLCSPSSTSPSATTSTASAAKPAFATIGETGL